MSGCVPFIQGWKAKQVPVPGPQTLRSAERPMVVCVTLHSYFVVIWLFAHSFGNMHQEKKQPKAKWLVLVQFYIFLESYVKIYI